MSKKKQDQGNTDIYQQITDNLLAIKNQSIAEHLHLKGFRKDSIKYEKAVELFEKAFRGTISPKGIQAAIAKIIWDALDEKSEITENVITETIQELQNKPVVKWECFMQIHGIKMDSAKLELGKYTICSHEYLKKYVEQKRPDTILCQTFLKKNMNEKRKETELPYYISVTEEEKESELAKIKSMIKFKQFEHIIGYMIGYNDNRYDVKILSPNRTETCNTLIFSGDNTRISKTKESPITPVPIDDKFFQEKKFGNKHIWSLTKKQNLNDIQKRLLNAVEWIGQGLREQDDSKAFIQCMFAIEGLLSIAQDKIINASIAHQLSEYAAFILEDDYKNRVKVYEDFKKSYGTRCSIAHGNKQTNISTKDMNSIMKIASRLVIKMSTDKELLEVIRITPTKKKDKASLAFYIEKKRFGPQ